MLLMAQSVRKKKKRERKINKNKNKNPAISFRVSVYIHPP
jgi:hypothetical protein